MHMPAGSPQAPILSCGASDQLEALRRALAPQRWPLDPALLPADALLVGGAVRDALLGRLGERPDLDLVVEGDAIALARGLARRCGGSCVVLDAERSIARLVLKGWSFDLARRMGSSLEQDLARRDYSINAIALPLAALCAPEACDRAATSQRAKAKPGPADDGPADGGPADGGPASMEAAAATLRSSGSASDLGPIDPGGGLADLRARRLRALGEANLLEDPLRLLRGVRLACELDFTIDAQTLRWIHTHHRRLGEVAGERVLAELERLAAAPGGAEGLLQVRRLGLLRGWQEARDPQGEAPGGQAPAPEARWLERLTPDRAGRCGLETEEQAWALPLARLAALLPPAALVRLRASRRLQQRSRRLRHWLERLENAEGPGEADGPQGGDLTLAGLPEEERLALQRELEEDLPALVLHLGPREAREALQRWRDSGDPLFHPRPPLDGQQLQERLGIPAGRTLGALLAHLTRERAFGRLAAAAGPDPVLQVARQWLDGGRNGEVEASSRGRRRD